MAITGLLIDFEPGDELDECIDAAETMATRNQVPVRFSFNGEVFSFDPASDNTADKKQNARARFLKLRG